MPVLTRLGLALAIGLLVGLERQRRGKEAGVRTFAFATLIGCLGGLLGGGLAVMSLGLVGLLVVFLNLERLFAHKDAELTTSAALIVMAFSGYLCGQGHTLTPSALAVLTAALLAWKESLADFSVVLTEAEVRSAILLAILAFVVYPALPAGTLDPWGVIAPQTAWLTVLLIAGIGFANYIFLKMHGPKAIELTGFFGGLVNSSVAVTALAERVREEGSLRDPAYRGIVLATLAMLVRNGVLLAILSPLTALVALPSLVLMLLGSLAALGLSAKTKRDATAAAPPLQLKSPFSFVAALEFGLVFLVLGAVGTAAQRLLGESGFFAVSLVGGVVSSASAVASAAHLAANGTIPVEVAGVGAALAAVTSAFVNLPLVARIAREQPLTRRIAWLLGTLVVLGLIGAYCTAAFGPRLLADFGPFSGPRP